MKFRFVIEANVGRAGNVDGATFRNLHEHPFVSPMPCMSRRSITLSESVIFKNEEDEMSDINCGGVLVLWLWVLYRRSD